MEGLANDFVYFESKPGRAIRQMDGENEKNIRISVKCHFTGFLLAAKHTGSAKPAAALPRTEIGIDWVCGD
jgi:hypothetical protein